MLESGRRYRIYSLVRDEALGTSIIEPPIYPPRPLPVVAIQKQAGVVATEFEFERTGEDTYRIRALGRDVVDREGGIYIVHEGDEEYIITYREAQDAYTIVKEGSSPQLAWTNPNREEDSNDQIVLKVLISTRSLPPRFLLTQLFRIEPIRD